MLTKSPDKFLIAIVAGAVLLVLAAFVVVLRQPIPAYLPENTPEGVMNNYLLAIQKDNYTRAYGYLSPSLAGYPSTVAAFASDVGQYSWQFGQDGDNTSFEISDSELFGNDAVVTIQVTHFYRGGLFDNGSSVESTQFTLNRAGESWQIVDGGYYFWVDCWDTTTSCP
jgi:hypothetical protein